MKRNHTHMGAKSIDEYAYLSQLKDVNCGIKLFFTIAVIVITVSAKGWIVPTIATLMCLVITVCFGKVNLKDYARLFTVPVAFLLMGAVAIAMSVKFEGGFSVAFHARDVHQAVVVTIKALGSVSAMYTLSLSTPVCEMVALLDRLKLPELLCELMRLTYRYIFILADSQVRMQRSAESRLGYDGYVRSLKTFGLVCSNLLTVSLRRANDYYNAIESRSFGGRLRFLGSSNPIRVIHVFAFGGCSMFLLVLELVLGNSL